jgi:hypothetical protein
MDHASRKQHRQDNSLPILADMHEWLIRLRTSTANNSGLARAIDYSLGRWPSLIRYAETGNLPIDNNPVHAANGMTAVMPTLGLCRVPKCWATTVGGILVLSHLFCRHYQSASRKASNWSGGLYRVGTAPLALE